MLQNYYKILENYFFVTGNSHRVINKGKLAQAPISKGLSLYIFSTDNSCWNQKVKIYSKRMYDIETYCIIINIFNLNYVLGRLVWYYTCPIINSNQYIVSYILRRDGIHKELLSLFRRYPTRHFVLRYTRCNRLNFFQMADWYDNFYTVICSWVTTELDTFRTAPFNTDRTA